MKRVVLWCVFLVAACAPEHDTIRVAGTIEIRQVDIAPLVAGRLVTLRRDEGDTGPAGDTIAVLMQPGLTERIAEGRARYEATLARLRDLEAGARSQELESARAALRSALADSARAAADGSRIERLYRDSIATESQRDLARSAATTSGERVRQAREALALLSEGPRAGQLAQARREAEAARASLGALEAQRDELTLTTPAAGIVLLRAVEEGEVVGPGTPVVRIGLTHRPWVRAYISQSVIGQVRVGAPVRVLVDAYPDTAFSGRILEINPTAEFIPRAALTERERADLVFAIKVHVDDFGGRLKAGMPVEVDIDLLGAP